MQQRTYDTTINGIQGYRKKACGYAEGLPIRKASEPIGYAKLVIDTEASLDSCVERAPQYLIQIARQIG